MKQSGYSNSDMAAMQQDAIRRVQEMHKRSQQKLHGNNANNTKNQSTHKTPPLTPPHAKGHDKIVHESKLVPQPQRSPIETILKELNLDNDRIILLVMLVVLINEGADKTLILALCYMLI